MRFFKDNALSLVMLALFAVFFAGQSLAGWHVHNQELQEHGDTSMTWVAYMKSPHLWQSTAENWESEFLQMAAFVALSAFLVQRGSAESKKPDDEETDDEREQQFRVQGESPWPVRKGGIYLAIYNHSLSLALLLLFVGSFVVHIFAGHALHNQDLADHGQPPVSLGEYVGSWTLWFESLQNWQSEFLSVGVLVVLTIFLRERGSPQSKPVAAPHRMTGSS